MAMVFGSIRRLNFRRGPSAVLGGVAGGIARSLNANVWKVRFLVLLSFALPGLGVGLYLLVWAITPWQDGQIPVEKFLARR